MTEPITVTVKEFQRLSGLCRDKVFELLNDGTLDGFMCGRKRLISVESYRRWVSDQIRRDQSIRQDRHGDRLRRPPISNGL